MAKLETFEKKNKGKKDTVFIRKVVHEEEIKLDENELLRMEKNANKQIEMANEVIAECNSRLELVNQIRSELKII
jgi:trans-2-enoyl-CoA reductase